MFLLLADIFKKFENNSLKNYGLCPSHYLRTPTLSWDVMLNTFLENHYIFLKLYHTHLFFFLLYFLFVDLDYLIYLSHQKIR